MRVDKLPERTRNVWEQLRKDTHLRGFVLVGGTALTLRMAHRISEDLDFVWAAPTQSTKDYTDLPVRRIREWVRDCRRRGVDIAKVDHIAKEQDFLNDGMDLNDFQQDYVLNGVKVTFFKASPELAGFVQKESGEATTGPAVASLETLFAAKSLVLTERSKTRDWFDLYILLHSGFDMAGMRKVFTDAHATYQWDSAILKLITLSPGTNDEGYVHLLDGQTLPTLSEMREFFRQAITALAQQDASALKKNMGLPKP
ncbi:MAG: nucleotidyl transferase AbiEii/AbiGii toxin family protein [Acidiferrobacter sp.]